MEELAEKVNDVFNHLKYFFFELFNLIKSVFSIKTAIGSGVGANILTRFAVCIYFKISYFSFYFNYF
jgi:hypothetical protein